MITNKEMISPEKVGRKHHLIALIVVSLILAFAVSSCSDTTRVGLGGRLGSGTIVTEERSVDDFNSIYMHGEGTVYLSQGEEVSIVVETDDNLIGHVYTDVIGKTLELSYSSGPFGTHMRPTKGYIYRITLVDLENVTIKGSAEVFAEAIVTDRLDLNVTGSGQIEIEDLNADEVSVSITGSGEIKVSGEAERQNISVTGSGTFDGRDFEGKYVQASNKGSGTVTVWATVDLDLSIAGGGEIHYNGGVVPNMNIASGSVQSLGDH